MIDINELRRLAQGATPGPWKMLPVGDGRQKFAVADSEFLSILTVTDEGGATFGTVYDDADAKFIAAANPAAINELLDRLEAAEKTRDDLLACLDEWLDKTKWVQQGVNEGAISAKYLGLHRADVMTSLLGEAEKERDAMRAAVRHEADCVEACKSEIERLRAENAGLVDDMNLLRDNNTALRARIEAMEKQEPVGLFARIDGDGPLMECKHADISRAPLYLASGAQPAPSVPAESIGKMLAQAMEVAVANGANSVSMPDELVEVAAWLSGVQPNPANGQTRAVRDVIAERRRQIEVECWAPEHDDRHGAHELAEAAACYCLSSAGKPFDYFETMWPWERWWFKVSDPRRDLVKAGALVLAEIERLDRAAEQKTEDE